MRDYVQNCWFEYVMQLDVSYVDGGCFLAFHFFLLNLSRLH